MKIKLSILLLLIFTVGCESRNIPYTENYDLRDVQILPDIFLADEGVLDVVQDIYEPPLKLIFEADKQRPILGEVALVPSVTDEQIMVIDMLLGGDDNMKLSFYGLYYRLSFPEDVLEVETVSPHPEIPAGIINKFTVRNGEIIGVITNKGDANMISLGCKKPLLSIRFRIKMIRTGRIDFVTSKTAILDKDLKPVVNNYYGGKLSIIQK